MVDFVVAAAAACGQRGCASPRGRALDEGEAPESVALDEGGCEGGLDEGDRESGLDEAAGKAASTKAIDEGGCEGSLDEGSPEGGREAQHLRRGGT